jgi:uncharacterized glyoxalase superfamily protein PhnB
MIRELNRRKMTLTPHLSFNGQCEAALKFYERCLGGKIITMLTWGDSPMATQGPPEIKSLNSRVANDLSKCIHAALTPSADQRISLKSVGQTPDHFLD